MIIIMIVPAIGYIMSQGSSQSCVEATAIRGQLARTYLFVSRSHSS